MNMRLLNIEAVSAALGVSPRMVRQLVANRAIASVRVGRLIRITEAALAAYIASNETPAQPVNAPPRMAVLRPIGRNPDTQALEDVAARYERR